MTHVDEDTRVGRAVSSRELDRVGRRESLGRRVGSGHGQLRADRVELGAALAHGVVEGDDLVAHEVLTVGDLGGEGKGPRLSGVQGGRLGPVAGGVVNTGFVDLDPLGVEGVEVGAVAVAVGEVDHERAPNNSSRGPSVRIVFSIQSGMASLLTCRGARRCSLRSPR